MRRSTARTAIGGRVAACSTRGQKLFQLRLDGKCSHHTVQVGTQDASTEDRQRVPNVADGVARERLQSTTRQCVRRYLPGVRDIPSRKANLASLAARPGGLRDGYEGMSVQGASAGRVVQIGQEC